MADVRLTPLSRHSDSLDAVRRATGGAIRLVELAPHSMINLRLDPDGPARQAAEQALGCDLPLTPNTSEVSGGRWVFWLGPDEWLIVDDDRGLDADLRTALDEHVASITDVSAARTIIEISGRSARELLTHGCALDLHPNVFGRGSCAQTRLALANVLLAGQGKDLAGPVYLVFVRSSFAAYLATWLIDASVEYTEV